MNSILHKELCEKIDRLKSFNQCIVCKENTIWHIELIIHQGQKLLTLTHNIHQKYKGIIHVYIDVIDRVSSFIV